MDYQENTKNVKTELQSSTFRQHVRLWLFDYPALNPYKFSFNRAYRLLTNKFRILPSFIIIGSTKSAGYSLMNYLRQHPSIQIQHNVHFFEYTYSNRLEWYRSHFPSSFYKSCLRIFNKNDLISGEMTSTYIFHPHVPERIRKTIPNVKLIVNLRNPVDRAYSAYNMMVREGYETRTFEDAINSELRRIELIKENNKLETKNPDFDNWVQFSYLRHGNYAEKLRTWMKLFPSEQFFIFSTDELNETPLKILNQLFKYLGTSNFEVNVQERHNVGKYEKMKESIKQFLVDYYRPSNKNLYKLIGKNFTWDK